MRVANPNLTEEQERFVRMEANGLSSDEIITRLWGMTDKKDPEYHKYECRLSRWRKHPKYMEVWRDEVSKISVRLVNKSLAKILKQMDSPEPWLANKAANDGLAFGKGRLFQEDDKTISVKVEGLPEIGSPTDDNG